MKLSLLVLALFSFQASAESPGLFKAEVSSRDRGPDNLNHLDPLPSELPSQFHHENQNTRVKCSPRVYSSTTEHSAVLDVRDLNVTIARRMMTLPAGRQPSDMDKWMKREMDNDLFDSIVWDKKVDGNLEDMATSVFREFKGKAFSLGTGFLCGCTTMVIVSHKGVYMGHYWESISFSPDKSWVKHYGSSQKCFEETVISGLNDGMRNGRATEQVSLKGKASKIEDPFIRAYLIIPTETDKGVIDGYRPRWNKMIDTVNQLLPTLNTQRPEAPAETRWTEVKYEALSNTDELLTDTARGRVLFKYDPDHNGKKKAALWVEQNVAPYHDEEW